MLSPPRTSLLSAMAIVFSALYDPAQAAEYQCRIPRALLCENCASQIVLSPRGDGRCRIAFTTEADAAKVPDAAGIATVNIYMPAYARATKSNAALVRRSTSWESAASRRCFVFNSAEYCE